ncbi:MAG: hypothetical protein AAGE96_19000 [Cyanobacteria bacterium P01_G01_bin.19]
MSSNPPLDKRKNKSFVINNKRFLKQYALQNYSSLGKGIIVVNLLLLKTDILTEEDITEITLLNEDDLTIHKPISYIPQHNFWFKMLNLKIKKKYEINIQDKEEDGKKFLIVFVKDASVEHFSIYSIRL